jgi:hypothetical protein
LGAPLAAGAAAEAHPDQRVAPMHLREDLPEELEDAVVLPVPVTQMLPVDAGAAVQAVAEAVCSPAPAA